MRYAPVLCIITPLLLFTLPSKAMAYEKGTSATAAKGTATAYTKKKKRYYKYKKSRKYKYKYASRRAVTVPVSHEAMEEVKAMDNAPLPQKPVKTWTLLSPWPMPDPPNIQLGEQSIFPTERFEAVFWPEATAKSDKLPQMKTREVESDTRWRLLPWVAGIIAFILVLCGSIFIPLIGSRKEPEPKPRTEPKLTDHASGVIFLNQHRRKRA